MPHVARTPRDRAISQARAVDARAMIVAIVAGMSIDAEIDATVTAFVAKLMDLVRRTALESVRRALEATEER